MSRGHYFHSCYRTAAASCAVLIVGSLYIHASLAQIGPSFDCGKVKLEPLTLFICGDPTLAETDLRHVQAYYALRQQLGPDGQTDLRDEEVDFVRSLESRCDVPQSGPAPYLAPQMKNCINAAYEQQRQVYMSRLFGAALEEASRSIRDHLALQQLLVTLGFLSSSATIDGVYGSTTRSAISDWQRVRGRSATGLLSDADAQAIVQEINQKRDEQQRQQREAQQRAREQDEALSAYRALLNSCKAYNIPSCDAALRSPLAAGDRQELVSARSTAAQFEGDLASCKNGSSAACDMALASPALPFGQRQYIEAWRTAASPWNKLKKFCSESASSVSGYLVGLWMTLLTIPPSTLVASGIAATLALALFLVLRSKGKGKSGASTEAQSQRNYYTFRWPKISFPRVTPLPDTAFKTDASTVMGNTSSSERKSTPAGAVPSQPARAPSAMATAAMILGILGGVFGFFVGLAGYALGGMAGAFGAAGAGLFQFLSIAMPIACIVGGGVAKANPMLAGILMLLSAAVMFWLFGFNFFTAIPLGLSGIGGVLAFVVYSESQPITAGP